jgi:hypothetical protein
MTLTTKRHDAIQEIFIEAIRTHFSSFSSIHRSCTVKFDDLVLSEKSANLRTDLWFVHPYNDSIQLIEFTVPYGCFDENSKVSTLELRPRDKISKYSNFVADCQPTFNRQTFLHVIIVSSLGVLEPHVFEELRSILGCKKRRVSSWCKRIIGCSLRGSSFVYYHISKMDVKRLGGLDQDETDVDMNAEDRIHQDLIEDMQEGVEEEDEDSEKVEGNIGDEIESEDGIFGVNEEEEMIEVNVGEKENLNER